MHMQTLFMTSMTPFFQLLHALTWCVLCPTLC